MVRSKNIINKISEDNKGFDSLPNTLKKVFNFYKNSITKIEVDRNYIWITVHAPVLREYDLKPIITANYFDSINPKSLAVVEFVFSNNFYN